jgi:predicted nucleic acid-binding protein
MKVLFDTNILLDVLLKREPHALAAVRLFAAVEYGQITGLITASTVPTLYYLIRKGVGGQVALTHLQNLLKLFEVAPVNRAILVDALQVGFPDYEDAVIHEAARHAGAEGIVTRNGQNFRSATLRIYSPDELGRIVQTMPWPEG